MTKQKQNYLDYVPGRNPAFPAAERGNGLTTVTIIQRGIFARIAQTFFHAPSRIRIDLDKYGSFVWKQINGTRSVYDIGELVRAEFGQEAEPLYPRLVKFFAILKEQRFISWIKLK